MGFGTLGNDVYAVHQWRPPNSSKSQTVDRKPRVMAKGANVGDVDTHLYQNSVQHVENQVDVAEMCHALL